MQLGIIIEPIELKPIFTEGVLFTIEKHPLSVFTKKPPLAVRTVARWWLQL
ncbi:MAG: hypothetical protein JNL70_23205 [Saprospiraceae bacterium]|nr:hypothetical protein [Saprospiraceae bacterium]